MHTNIFLEQFQQLKMAILLHHISIVQSSDHSFWKLSRSLPFEKFLSIIGIREEMDYKHRKQRKNRFCIVKHMGGDGFCLNPTAQMLPMIFWLVKISSRYVFLIQKIKRCHIQSLNHELWCIEICDFYDISGNASFSIEYCWKMSRGFNLKLSKNIDIPFTYLFIQPLTLWK